MRGGGLAMQCVGRRAAVCLGLLCAVAGGLGVFAPGRSTTTTTTTMKMAAGGRSLIGRQRGNGHGHQHQHQQNQHTPSFSAVAPLYSAAGEGETDADAVAEAAQTQAQAPRRNYREEAEGNRRKAKERYEKSNPKKFDKKKAVYDHMRSKARKKEREEFLAGAFPRNVTISMSDLERGQWLQGRVRNLTPFGAYVDVGAERDGLLHVKDMSDGFVAAASIPTIVKSGQEVDVCVKFVNAEEGKIALSLVSLAEAPEHYGERVPLDEIEEGNEVWGEVVKVSNLGAYVDSGMTVDGFLHVREYPRHDGRSARDVFKRGQRVRCWVLEVNEDMNRVKLTGYRPDWLPRVGGTDRSKAVTGGDGDKYERGSLYEE